MNSTPNVRAADTKSFADKTAEAFSARRMTPTLKTIASGKENQHR
jgi:hypothetical protein